MVAIVDGRIGGVWVRLGPIGALGTPQSGEVVLRLPDGGAVLARRTTRPGRIEWLDRAGTVVLEEPTWFDANLTLTREAYAPGDAFVTAPARDVVAADGDGGSEITDADGFIPLDGPFTVSFDGPHLTIFEDGRVVRVRDVADDDLRAGTDLSHEVATVHHHYEGVRRWLASRWSDPSGLDQHTTATVDDLAIGCNAYYDNAADRFGFSPPFEGCPAMARFGDIVAHEAGHRIHWKPRDRRTTCRRRSTTIP
jgi:hypothetical protein